MLKAEPKDKSTVVDILTKAFNENRSFNSIIKQDKNRVKRIRKVFEYYFDVCSKSGLVYLSDDKKACAVVSFPDQLKVTFKSILMDIRLLFLLGFKSVRLGVRREAKINKVHPESNFYYLLFIGVDPDFQYQGIGSKLLKELITDSKLLGRPVYLETYLEKNITLYQRFGFTIYKELDCGFPLFCMKREFI
ncbi:GNAT family N-acetyltransferase [Pedobacter cryoconitis]|uniref:Ribosomal protein S18 acetylase RimI-like enzyme n=1 Tax=Pedobacter cryoconitis TaxID=188932 RepID=A0A7X0J2J3_9SPHI|nr:GNAT family N-acetyltransferase [Pedobacter cryoconitis]MBB6498461.1 ribosomal protein S18 acetylase RimI-like enzyme [Pedobacter cryoconitis]